MIPPRRSPRALLGVGLLLLASPARAGELCAQVGLSARASSWAGDVAGGPRVGFGYRFARTLTLDVLVWEELATVDNRLDTGLTLGVGGVVPREGLRPAARLYVLHQHEEGLVSVAQSPFTVIAGIGPGIRHRAGAGAWLGAEIPLAKRGHVEWVALTGVDATWFPDDSLGPAVYAGGTFAIGLHYTVEELP